MTYEQIIAAKRHAPRTSGFAPRDAHSYLHPWQLSIVDWACRLGRAAIFADTGLGKTRMQLAWASEVARHAGGRVLVVSPLAVSAQTRREGESCGIDMGRIDQINYESLHRATADYVGVVLDESSILKSFTGSTTRGLIERFASTPFRLACSATPSPNDYEELGNHAEFLGVMSRTEMLARWFVNDSSTTEKWQIKGHGRQDFWRWIASWAVSCRYPSDLGDYSDRGYVLPGLREHLRVVDVDLADGRGNGQLFRAVDLGIAGFHDERRRTAAARAAEVAACVGDGQCLIWADTDYDADAVAAAVPDAIQVHGRMDGDEKSRRLLGFADGDVRVLLTKPKIAGFGLNFQRCDRMVFAGPSYSYEQYYQAVRRCWRFGQAKPVDVYAVLAETEQDVWRAVSGKARLHDSMRDEMIAASRSARTTTGYAAYAPSKTCALPDWVTSHA